MRIKLVTIFLGLLTVSVPLFAHHGAAAYDTTKKITVKGTVTEWFWAKVTVTFTPVKNGQPIGRVEQVVLADGQIFKARVVF